MGIASSSVHVARSRLAAELRKARQQAGLTIDEVAERLEWSSAKISRIENARVTVLPRDVKFLPSTYGLTDRDEIWDALLGLARESRQKGWWQQYGDAIRDWFEVYVGLEAQVANLNCYHTEFVNGLLQTRDYASAVHRAWLPTATDEEGTVARVSKSPATSRAPSPSATARTRTRPRSPSRRPPGARS